LHVFVWFEVRIRVACALAIAALMGINDGFIICLMLSQLQCHETTINLIMHTFTQLTHQQHFSGTVAVTLWLRVGQQPATGEEEVDDATFS